ncbi:MAG: 50S ribosomal protein L15 [Myxococcales bacterium 68-20]|nr:50S ribosomal protein L15 [Myxococcales bacterium]OJY21126.1 MAG: 50S ribosomal protein L15 [Myxococcales bacterium 68-20]
MADTLSKLAKPEGATKKKTRRGRGPGSGLGKTAGRGQKGQYARRATFKPSFEGGQTPLARRLPKRGFTKHNQAVVAEINVGQLEAFDAGANVDERALRDRGLVKGQIDRIKVLGSGDLTKKITVTAHSFSKSAQEKIAKAGGTAVLVAQAQSAPAGE